VKRSNLGIKYLSSVVLLVVLNSNIIANNLEDEIDNIVLKDETSKSLMKQDKIIGCDDTLKIDELKCSKERTAEDRDRDIDEIKAQLNEILKQLAELKKVKDIQAKDNQINTIENRIKKLTVISDNNKTLSYHKPKKIKVIEKRDDCVIVEVQTGESLSKYAYKYYGDGRKYHNIYRANRDKISKDLQIYIGDRLIIPTSKSYQYPQWDIEKKESNDSNVVNIIQEEENVIEMNSNNDSINNIDKVIYVEDSI
jgi:hypothetical protein